MGTVYEGWDPVIARRVAIKTVRITDAEDAETEEQLARFRREAQAAGRLIHPNIVGVFDYGESNDVAYIVMEFVDGPSVKSLLDKQERFALPDILRIMEDLLTGLQFSHERGVVHRDIKPANLMLTTAGQAKIADFGIARIESSSMTQAGTVLGTPAYMSPEQFMGEVVDARSDLYSSGVVLYQLLTGERPFEGGLSAIMHKVLNTEPPAPSLISVTCPAAFDAVVRKAMARRPEDRFQSATEFLQALRAAAAGGRGEEPADTGDEATLVAPAAAAPASSPHAPARAATAAETPAKKRSALPLVLAALLVAVLAAGGGAWVFLKRGPAPTRTAATQPTTATNPAPAAVGNPAPVPPGHVAQQQASTATPQPPPVMSPAPPAAGTGQAANTATAGSQAGTPTPASSTPVAPPPSSSRQQAEAQPESGQQPGLASHPATPPPSRQQATTPPDNTTQQAPVTPPAERPPASQQQAVTTAPTGSTGQQATSVQPSSPPRQQAPATSAPSQPSQQQAAGGPSHSGHAAPPPGSAGSATPTGTGNGQSQVASVGLGAVRQQLDQVIARQNCSVLNGTVEASGTIALGGLAGTYAADSVRQALAGRPLDWQVTSVDPYYCPALDVVHPIAAGTGVIGSQLGLTLASGKVPLRDGQRILPQLVMPDFRGYLRVDYVTHDGAVMHLYPQVADPSQRITADPQHAFAAGTTVKLGRPSPGHPEWLVGEPYGTDMIIAVASSRPLFSQSRPSNVESASAYLAALQSAVDTARRSGDRLAGSAITVDTLPKK